MNDEAIKLIALGYAMGSLSPDGGYGGIDMCIRCKQKGADRYLNDKGEEVNACDYCPNNMLNGLKYFEK